MRSFQQTGVSLIEFMVSIVIGLVIAASMLGVYVSSIISSGSTLSASKLNQELSSLMLVVSNDIRRAGFWGTPDVENLDKNPFSKVGNTALVVVDNLDDDNQLAANTNVGGECILYAYDADADGVVDNTDIFGIRLNDGVVQMREQGNAGGTDNDSCTTGTWQDLTDGSLVSVTRLRFILGRSQCINTDEPNGADDDGNGIIDDESLDCYSVAPGTGAITVETREVGVEIDGKLVGDSAVSVRVSQNVRVRNDLVRIR